MPDKKDVMKIELEMGLYNQANAFHYKNTFYQEELRKAVKIIIGILDARAGESNSSECSFREEQHIHEAIGIFGPRGIGKTSFMLTLKKYINEKNNELSKQLFFLPMIDPSMLEETEFFLITLVSLICSEVQEVIEECTCKEGKLHKTRDDMESDVDKWYKSLRELSKHMIAINGKAFQRFFDEKLQMPDVFFQDALNIGRSGKQLASTFHEFIHASICILKKKKKELCALVIFIDDIDTAFHNGWPVLETIRKYLTSREIILVASGDLPLYDTVIKRTFIEEFKELKHITSGHCLSNTYRRQISSLTKQYLLKIFPTENRIRLPFPIEILYKERSGDVRITVISKSKEKNNSNALSLQESLKNLLDKFNVKIFRLSHNNKSILGIIPSSNRELIRLIELVLLPCLESEPDKNQIILSLLKVFEHHLSEVGLSIDLLRQANYTSIEHALFLQLIQPWRENKGDEGLHQFYRFIPRYGQLQSEKNQIVLVIQAVLNSVYASNPYRIMDYWFLIADMYINCRILTNNFNKEKLEQYILHLHLDTQREAPHLISARTAWEHVYSNSKIGIGSFQIDENIWNRIRNIEDGQYKLIIDTISFKVITESDMDYLYINFFRGLSVLNEIIKQVSEADNQRRSINVINMWRMLRLYNIESTIGAKMSDKGIKAEFTEHYKPDPSLNSSNELFLELIQLWLEKYGKNNNSKNSLSSDKIPPVSVLAKIWNRIHFNLSEQMKNIVEDLDSIEKIEHLTKEINILSEKLKELHTDKEEINIKLMIREKRKDEIVKQISEKQTQLEEAEKEVEFFSSKLQDVITKKEIIKDKISNLRLEIRTIYEARLFELQNEISNTHYELAVTELKIKNIDDEMEEKKSELNKLQNQLPGQYKSVLSKMLKMSTTIFLNSVLVEESWWRNKREGLNSVHVSVYNSQFEDNIEKIKESPGSYPFFEFWFNCPYFIMMLERVSYKKLYRSLYGEDFDEQKIYKLQDFVKEQGDSGLDYKDFKLPSVYDLLQESAK